MRSVLVATALWAFATASGATAQIPALDRPAMAVRSPERTVLLAASLAGPRVVVVGERGIVALSDDEGRTWRQAKTVPVSVTLTAVQFLDAKRGWAVGHGGVILHSQDGGETWTRQADGRSLAKASVADGASQAAHGIQPMVPDEPLFDVRFADAKRGYVVGAYNLAFETLDGGSTWTNIRHRIDNPKGSHLYSVAIRGDSIYIVGEQGVMFHSRDRGSSFMSMSAAYRGSWFSVVPVDERGLVAAGLRGNAAYSPDEGKTWHPIPGAPQATLVAGFRIGTGNLLLANQAGQLLTTRAGAAFEAVRLPSPLPPPAGLLPLSDGALLVVGLTGAIRLRAPEFSFR